MFSRLLCFVSATVAAVSAAAQVIPVADTDDTLSFGEPDSIDVLLPDQYVDEDSLDIPDRYFVQPLSRTVFLPAVYTNYIYLPDQKLDDPQTNGDPWMQWVDAATSRYNLETRIQQNFMIRYPHLVRYNMATLPVAPKRYFAKVNPKDHTIEVSEVERVTPDMKVDVVKRHWLRTFESGLQFSQAYISPNWYQGGNNNLNMLVNIYYNVKLNQAYHPNLLFESTMQYKLGLNNAPDDSLRNYAISEDLLQLNTTFGYKAARRWYYSVTAQFKTQLLNSYAKNTDNLKSAFLSPAEFNAGLGMTYNYVNKKKTVTFDASIAPLSYNMKICTRSDDDISHAGFDIDPDKTYTFNIGSTAELKFQWQLASNIQFRSRIFAFTDYSYIQGDWENTLSMNINRYLSTQIYAHLRYDSTTPRTDDPHWHKLQVKEVLSFGVSYRFSSI